MDRRKFLKKSLLSGAAVGAALAFPYGKSLAGIKTTYFEQYDLVAVKGSSPSAMFDAGIKSLGGINQFVKKGQSVVIKPNIGWDKAPEFAANTNPELVKRIIQHCLSAGAKTIYVFDNTCDNWTYCYKNSGIEKAVKDAGGKMVPGNTESYYQEIEVSKGKNLKTTKIHELILESDVFINVPVLKHHASTDLTMGMKNLMGIVWDRRWWHRNNLHQCIADFASYRKPDLNIIDAYRILTKNGPKGVTLGDVLISQSQIISPDIVAADAASAKIFGLEPESIPYIKYAHEMKIGNMNLDKLNINRIKL